jgi:hypothetical protein
MDGAAAEDRRARECCVPATPGIHAVRRRSNASAPDTVLTIKSGPWAIAAVENSCSNAPRGGAISGRRRIRDHGRRFPARKADRWMRSRLPSKAAECGVGIMKPMETRSGEANGDVVSRGRPHESRGRRRILRRSWSRSVAIAHGLSRRRQRKTIVLRQASRFGAVLKSLPACRADRITRSLRWAVNAEKHWWVRENIGLRNRSIRGQFFDKISQTLRRARRD